MCVCVCVGSGNVCLYTTSRPCLCVCVSVSLCVCVLGTHDRGESGERGSHGEQECAGHKCNCLMSMKPCVLSSPLPTRSPAASVCQALLSSPQLCSPFKHLPPYIHTHMRTRAHRHTPRRHTPRRHTPAHVHTHTRTRTHTPRFLSEIRSHRFVFYPPISAAPGLSD